MRNLALILAAASLLSAKPETVLVLTTAGKTIEGTTSLAAITVDGRKVPLASLLSLHNGAPATPGETGRIERGFAAIQAYKNEPIASPERRNRDAAVEELTAMGLAVLTPLLRTLKDTDQHEPRPLYRLFERLVPSEADQPDRQAALLRLATGQYVRGQVAPFTLDLNGEKLAWSDIRRLAVRRKSVTRATALHSIQHCTQIEYLDTGILTTAASAITSGASGFARLSWDADSWASGPNGLTVPGSPAYKSHLWDGHPFGSIVGKVTAGGAPFFVGASYNGKANAAGPLHLAINDNRHWQNNVGHFRITLTATNAYDVGSAQ